MLRDEGVADDVDCAFSMRNALVEIKPLAAKMGTTLLRLVVSCELRSRVGRRAAKERRHARLSLSGASVLVLAMWCRVRPLAGVCFIKGMDV